MNSVELICGEISLKKNRTFVESNILYAVPIKSILKKCPDGLAGIPIFCMKFHFHNSSYLFQLFKKKPLLVFKRVC